MRFLWVTSLLLISTSFAATQEKPLHGIDLTDLNRSVNPCTDFYEFANGNWRAHNPIPPSQIMWSRLGRRRADQRCAARHPRRCRRALG